MATPAHNSATSAHTTACEHSDAAELARLNRALTTLSEGNRTLLRAADEQQLLQSMCEVIVSTGGYRFAAVVYALHDAGKTLQWVACAGIDLNLMNPRPLTWADSPLGQTAIGTAIRTGQPVVGRNVQNDPAYDGPEFDGARANARRLGFSSATAFPLLVDGEVMGALSMGAVEPDAFDQAEILLLSELADDLAHGIANQRTRVQHREAQATIARLAYFDTLTGLPNRTQLLEKVEQAIAAAARQQGALALLHLEVGRFREINKVLGYRSGDELLKKLARRLSDAAVSNATLARVGEAEFALLLPDASLERAVAVARMLVHTMRQPVEVTGLMLDARVGIGIAMYPSHGQDADSLMRRANAAMHQTKPARGGYAIYTGGQELEHTRRLALMGDLYDAVAHNELRLFCQPKVDFASRAVCGAEALIRWQHPRKGMISPTEFIPLAEQAGMITPLTNWMLEAAFRQCHAWKQAGNARPLAINLSALDLYDPDLIDRIGTLFSSWEIAPELIQFELTESTLMVDPAEALETLMRLKMLSVQLFIDDFGTGHSSLRYLQQLPVDGVKIDQSFVMPMVRSTDSATIVRSTIELGHNLGMSVVAEGVENQPIWERLSALGCDVAQGYLISVPMPAERFDAWEAQWTRKLAP